MKRLFVIAGAALALVAPRTSHAQLADAKVLTL
jgi:hypothetical protein